MYVVSETNEWILNKTDEEITSLDYRFFVGVKSPVKYYDNETGKKTHQDYLYKRKNDEIVLAIRQFYTDVLDENENIIDVEVTTYWFEVIGDHLVKTERLNLSSNSLDRIITGRRKRIKSFIINEARTCEKPFVKEMLAIVFNFLAIELETWVNTSDATFFHNKIDSATANQNPDLITIFEGIADAPESILDLMLIEAEEGISVKDYLKTFIK